MLEGLVFRRICILISSFSLYERVTITSPGFFLSAPSGLFGQTVEWVYETLRRDENGDPIIGQFEYRELWSADMDMAPWEKSSSRSRIQLPKGYVDILGKLPIGLSGGPALLFIDTNGGRREVLINITLRVPKYI